MAAIVHICMIFQVLCRVHLRDEPRRPWMPYPRVGMLCEQKMSRGGSLAGAEALQTSRGLVESVSNNA